MDDRYFVDCVTVDCVTCGVSSKIYSTKEDAIAAWNRRAPASEGEQK